MRSKTFQRILDKMDNDPWSVKLKRLFVVEISVLNCIGFVKYFFQPFFSLKVLFKKDVLFCIFQNLIILFTIIFLFWVYFKFLIYTVLLIYLLSI